MKIEKEMGGHTSITLTCQSKHRHAIDGAVDAQRTSVSLDIVEKCSSPNDDITSDSSMSGMSSTVKM